MTIKEIEPLMNLLKFLKPYDSRSAILDAKDQTNDRLGEYAVKARPSDALMIFDTYTSLKAKIEMAQLEGKDTI